MIRHTLLAMTLSASCFLANASLAQTPQESAAIANSRADKFGPMLPFLSRDKCNSDERYKRTVGTLNAFRQDPANQKDTMASFVGASDKQCCCVKAMVGPENFSKFLLGLGIPADNWTHHGCPHKGKPRCP
ncbi:MAG: hypothetical protein ACQGVK_22290 [Myxococcota bacterium]